MRALYDVELVRLSDVGEDREAPLLQDSLNAVEEVVAIWWGGFLAGFAG